LHNNRQGIQVATLAETTRITMQLPPERLLELWCEWCSRTCRLSIVQGACWHVMDCVVLIANKSNSTDLCWNDNICLWHVQIMYYPIKRLRGGRHW
jgi:hypothetical protein